MRVKGLCLSTVAAGAFLVTSGAFAASPVSSGINIKNATTNATIQTRISVITIDTIKPGEIGGKNWSNLDNLAKYGVPISIYASTNGGGSYQEVATAQVGNIAANNTEGQLTSVTMNSASYTYTSNVPLKTSSNEITVTVNNK